MIKPLVMFVRFVDDYVISKCEIFEDYPLPRKGEIVILPRRGLPKFTDTYSVRQVVHSPIGEAPWVKVYLESSDWRRGR